MFRDRTDAAQQLPARLRTQLVCLLVSPEFRSVGQLYGDFIQVDDAEVIATLGDVDPHQVAR